MADASNAPVPVNAAIAPGPSNATNAVPASVAAVPMDEDTMQQPVIAYFQFIQNNVQHIQAGDVERVMQEAEQRHREIMQSMFEGIRAQFQQEMNAAQAAHSQQLAQAQNQFDQVRQQLTDAEM